MGRKSIADTRKKEIIHSFYKISKTNGLENTSIAKVAEAININPSLVMHYFKTREHLENELVDYILDRYLLIFSTPKQIENEPLERIKMIIDNLFSKKWNSLIDDSVSYSCYALSFRKPKIKQGFKTLLDNLRSKFEELIVECNQKGILNIKDAKKASDQIYTLVDGAYYYLSLTKNNKEYQEKVNNYKAYAFEILGLNP